MLYFDILVCLSSSIFFNSKTCLLTSFTSYKPSLRPQSYHCFLLLPCCLSLVRLLCIKGGHGLCLLWVCWELERWGLDPVQKAVDWSLQTKRETHDGNFIFHQVLFILMISVQKLWARMELTTRNLPSVMRRLVILVPLYFFNSLA